MLHTKAQKKLKISLFRKTFYSFFRYNKRKKKYLNQIFSSSKFPDISILYKKKKKGDENVTIL